ncbi:Centrosomal protein of 83 kDa [Borealophlyctis nickersoniae]|nr:Centrosomal protein of 83 kDa [Borealophlyctis nickersoniae]
MHQEQNDSAGFRFSTRRPSKFINVALTQTLETRTRLSHPGPSHHIVPEYFVNPTVMMDKLKVALSLVETLKQENEVYKDNFDQLKRNYERFQERHDGLSKEFDICSKEKSALETHLTEQESYYKALVAEKTREVEEARNCRPQQKEIELVRLKLTKEFEAVQEKKWRNLGQEITKYRDMYYKLRREHEIVRAEFERQAAEHQSVQTEVKQSHQEEMALLEARLSALRESIDSMTDSERVRTLQRENGELQLKIQHLLSEIDQLRAEKESLGVEHDQQTRLLQRRLMEEITLSKAVAAEKDAVVAKVNSLETELKQSLKYQDQLSEENTRLSKEVDKAKARLEETVHKFNVEVSDMKLTVLKERGQAENEIGQSKAKLAEVKSSLKTASETIHDLRQKLCSADKTLLERVRAAQEEEWGKIARLEGEKTELEKQIGHLKERLREMEAAQDGYKKEANTDISRLKSQVSQLTTSNDALITQTQSMASEKERLAAENDTMRCRVVELEAQLVSLTQDVDGRQRGEAGLRYLGFVAAKQNVECVNDSMIVLSLARDKISSLESALQAVQSELTQTNDHLEKEREAYLHDLERQRSTWSKEKHQLHQSLEDMRRERDNLTGKAHGLEESLLQHKMKISQLKTRLKEFKEEIGSLRKRNEAEKAKADAVERDMRQRHVDFLSLLQSEGVVDSTSFPELSGISKEVVDASLRNINLKSLLRSCWIIQTRAFIHFQHHKCCIRSYTINELRALVSEKEKIEADLRKELNDTGEFHVTEIARLTEESVTTKDQAIATAINELLENHKTALEKLKAEHTVKVKEAEEKGRREVGQAMGETVASLQGKLDYAQNNLDASYSPPFACSAS